PVQKCCAEMMSVSVARIQKNRCRTTIAERMVETRAELQFIGDQVGLFRAQPGRPKRTCNSTWPIRNSGSSPRSLSIKLLDQKGAKRSSAHSKRSSLERRPRILGNDNDPRIFAKTIPRISSVQLGSMIS